MSAFLVAARPPLLPAQSWLVWAFRLWVGDRENWRLIARRLQARYGDRDGARAVRGLATMICALRHHATRKIRHYPDGAPEVSADELCLVRALTLAEQGGDPVRACSDFLQEAGWASLRAGLADLVAVLTPDGLSYPGLAAAE